MIVAFRKQLFTCYAILWQMDGNVVLKRDKKPHSTGQRSQYALKLKTKRRESQRERQQRSRNDLIVVGSIMIATYSACFELAQS